RQDLPVLNRTIYPSQSNVKNGAYILKDAEGQPEIILIASGSEVSIALDVTSQLHAKGVKARLLSMPSFELFRLSSGEYKNHILPPTCRKRVAIEAAARSGWYEFVGLDGIIVGIDHYGASAPAKVLSEHFGFTAKNILTEINKKWGI
ncbi:MAG TPA: transketolase-like TK C-terminal-containing protein, partial [Candidatus Brocadiaceae bacterium]